MEQNMKVTHLRPIPQNEDIPCAVCRSTSTTTTIMIPGKQTCYNGWKIEYEGFIASVMWALVLQITFASIITQNIFHRERLIVMGILCSWSVLNVARCHAHLTTTTGSSTVLFVLNKLANFMLYAAYQIFCWF